MDNSHKRRRLEASGSERCAGTEALLTEPLALSCSPEDIFNLPLTEDYLVIDTRPAEAFALAHLPNARSLPTHACSWSSNCVDVDAHVVAWIAKELERDPPDQQARAAVLGDPADANNAKSLNAIAAAIARHPRFQRGHLCAILVSEGGHEEVVAKYPFLSGKDWSDLPTAYPSEVQPRLFLGSEVAAKSRQVFEDLQIRAVVNTARELPNFFEGDSCLQLSYLKLDLDDDPDQDLAESIDMALPFIAAQLQQGCALLVHCKMGQSRSVSVVLAHLMSTLGCGYDRALALIRCARPLARPNEGFAIELRSLEGRLIYGPKQ